jgi:transcriptional regulator with XRE-family HTH domain
MKTSFPVIDLQATGKNIKRLREKAGLSVRDLQTVFEFETPQAIYKWQWGFCLPTIENLIILSRVLDTPIDAIIIIGEGR